MPKVLERTKSARGAARNCGRCGRPIPEGERYYLWSFRYGGTRYACKDHRPRPSELTQSKMAEVYAAIEGAEDELPNADDVEAISTLVSNVAEVAGGVAEEYRDAAEPFGGEGENAERADELEGWAQELEGFYPEDDAALDDTRAEASDLLGGCPL